MARRCKALRETFCGRKIFVTIFGGVIPSAPDKSQWKWWSRAEGTNCYYPVLRAFKVPSVLSCRVAPNSLDNFIIWTDVEDVSRMFHM